MLEDVSIYLNMLVEELLTYAPVIDILHDVWLVLEIVTVREHVGHGLRAIEALEAGDKGNIFVDLEWGIGPFMPSRLAADNALLTLAVFASEGRTGVSAHVKLDSVAVGEFGGGMLDDIVGRNGDPVGV